MPLLLGLLLFSCNDSEERLFRTLPASETGIDFSNDIVETDSLNILNFHYIYNGGGVGVGDFNQDGWPDLVFSGNQVPAKIYLNQKGLHFKNITITSNLESKGWGTGVSIADVNADGWPDIYLSVGGLECEGECKNQLFIHQGLDENGIPKFKEMAEHYGLDDGLYTQQALFFDYDQDGDLDVYLLHNVIDPRDKNAPSPKRFINEKSRDRLLRNNTISSSSQSPLEEPVPNSLREGRGGISKIFTDVSDSLGITHRGYGLGVTLTDFNLDGQPDIYVANDFLSDDLLYLNLGRKDGAYAGFKEVSHEFLKHETYNSMGVDIADLNGDALPETVVVDMMPAYQERQKSMMGFMNYDKFLMTLRQGYAPQFIRNTLQTHNGFLDGEMLPFSEVGYYSGVYATDWSWTPLLADFDLDGDRDLFVSNGYGKDITDLDFINYSSEMNTFGTPEAKQKRLFEVVQRMEDIRQPNFIFENRGELKFQDKSGMWMEQTPTISNGAIYADLDLDGDLDLVVNNLNDPAFILENLASDKTKNHFLQIKLKGSAHNPTAIGATVDIWIGGKRQRHFQSPVRGYLGTVSEVAHFGLGEKNKVDSVIVIWPNGQKSKREHVEVDQVMEVNFEEKTIARVSQYPNTSTSQYLTSNSQYLNFSHTENPYQDFDAQPLLLHQHSRQGPCMAVGNVDGWPGDEFFIGGAKGVPGRLFSQNENGEWGETPLDGAESEDTDALFFDLENDGDLDLYVVTGGVEFKDDAPEFQDKIYLNDGFGNFTLSTDFQSPAKGSGSCVTASDFDLDGDLDLFIGGRVSPRRYPEAPRSFLIKNENGKLIDITPPTLKHLGMVTDAIWSDVDGDEWPDLFIVGEWMPVTLFQNEKGKLIQNSKLKTQNYSGLWNCIAEADLDGDGDPDFILGNLGENSRLKASPKEPITLFADDHDENGSPDPLIAQFYPNKKGERKSYPIHARDDVVRQLVKVKSKYVKYADFGEATFSEMLSPRYGDAQKLEVNHLGTSILRNNGDGEWKLEAMPPATQMAPIQCILVEDVNADGYPDVLLSGNDFTAEKNGGWYDAFNGLLLLGDGKNLNPAPISDSGFFLPGDGRDIVKVVDGKGKRMILAGQNSGELKVFEY